MKARALLLLISLMLVGCGGGGKGPIQPPSNPPNNPPSQPSDVITYIIGPSEVKSGDVANLELTTGDSVKDQILAEADVSWSYQPKDPSILFQKLQDSRNWQVTFPEVSVRTIYTISFLAVNVELNMRFTGSTQIVVNPKPVVNPPKVTIYYPWESMPETRVVGPGVKLQIVGQIRQGTNTVVKLEILVDDRVVLTIPNPDYEFRFDLEEFGVPGTKPLIIRAIDSSGVAGESSVEIINDPAELERLARDFLLKYATVNGRVVRFMSLSDGPPSKPIKVLVNRALEPYLETIRQGVDFWTRYTGLSFVVEITQKDDLKAPEDYGSILLRLETVDTNSYAKTWKFYTDEDAVYKVGIGLVALYRGWLTSANELKALIVAHELGHVLLVPDSREGHTTNGSFMDAGATEWNFHPYMQLAVRILYSKNPGESL